MKRVYCNGFGLLIGMLLVGANPTWAQVPPSSAPATPEDTSSRYVDGRWTYPNFDVFEKFFPKEALRQHISGEASLDCQINKTGRLEECKILSESPVGLGFGTATVAAFVQYVYVDPNSIEGGLKEGDRKKFFFRWLAN